MRALRRILFLFFIIVVQGTLILLSLWQWDRLAQKEAAIALRDQRWSSEAIPLETAILQSGMTPDWSHVVVCGQVKPEKYVKVSYISGQPKAAFSLVIPMLADIGSLGNRNIFLDVGFIHFDEETKFSSSKNIQKDASKECVTGHIMPIPPRPRWTFGAANDPKTYSYFDVDMMASRLQMNPYMPIVVRLDTPLSFVEGGVRRYDQAPPNINNPHRGYAYTWLALAVLWPVMMGLRWWRG